MTDTALLEPSFADLIAAIAQAPELSEQRRRHWVCSLQQIAQFLDRPVTVIPARWSAVRRSVPQLHHARVGVTAKTLANHKSNVRGALRWFGKEHDLPQRGMPLSAEWVMFRERIDDCRLRQRLSNLMRYCSARRIEPALVDDKVFDEYWRYRTETTALASNNTRPTLHGAGVECLRGCNEWLHAAATHRAAQESVGQARLGRLPGGPARGR